MTWLLICSVLKFTILIPQEYRGVLLVSWHEKFADYICKWMLLFWVCTVMNIVEQEQQTVNWWVCLFNGDLERGLELSFGSFPWYLHWLNYFSQVSWSACVSIPFKIAQYVRLHCEGCQVQRYPSPSSLFCLHQGSLQFLFVYYFSQHGQLCDPEQILYKIHVGRHYWKATSWHFISFLQLIFVLRDK